MKLNISKTILVLTVVLALSIWGYIFISLRSGATAKPVLQTDQAINSDQLFTLIQQWRNDNGYPLYQVDQRLCSVLDIRLQEVKNNWGHDDLQSKKESIYAWGYSAVGENLTSDTTASGVLYDWLNSSGHLNNLKASATHTCVKCDYHTCMQIFAK